MSEEEFNGIVSGLKRGDNTVLSMLQPFQDDCIRTLVVKSGANCSAQQAYDIFVESVLDFRKNILLDKVVYQNIPAYIQRICWYKWLEMSRSRQRHEREKTMIRAHLYPVVADPESIVVGDEEYARKLALLRTGMQGLSERCRRVLTMAISDGIPMTEIARQLGMASADVAKTTKSRCYKRLIKLIRNP